ncbi:DUF4253 domain-containing protein [Stackebrandtia soli]|uniref:DUF4253 domain-containing protein n=1 Tax=Stackebrandtia soli TaxID=1892856 RepID=UPI0039ECFD98
MGLLQKLLGRRLDDDGDTGSTRSGPASPDTEPESSTQDETPVDEAEPTPAAPSSPVLGDAAPLPDEPLPRPAVRVSAPLHEWPGYPKDDEPATATDPPELVDPPAAEEAVSTPVDAPSEPTAPAPPAAEPAAHVTDHPSPKESAAIERPTEADAAALRRPALDDYFVPERPRRQLLDLDPPTPPPDEKKPSSTALPMDVSGSPRAALRAAGVAVPPMQQIVRRGDVRLWAFGVRASEALGWWLQIRQVHDKTGWLPVLLGSPDDWLDNGEGVLHEGEDELSRLSEVSVSQLFEDKAAEAGEPPRGVPILQRRGDSDFAVPKTDGLLGLIEADYGWQIPALLPWKGSTNWELYGAEHASVLRHWHELHEVELVSMTWDILELYVPSPPTEDEDVLQVAQEVYAYCPDLMAAGVPTLDDLALHMVRSRAWYFRWA